MKKENQVFFELIDEMVEMQRDKLLRFGSKIRPNLTTDDLLQPNDYPELEMHPLFRYEEGVLEGLMSARAAIARELSEIT